METATGEKKSRGRPKRSIDGDAGAAPKEKKEIDPTIAKNLIKKHNTYVAETYQPLPIVLARGRVKADDRTWALRD